MALKLGAREVVGTDLDADCMTSTRDNMQVNHLDLSLGTLSLIHIFLRGRAKEMKYRFISEMKLRYRP